MKMKSILLLIFFLTVFIGLSAETGVEFSRIKHIVLNRGANADTLAPVIDSLKEGWAESYERWKTLAQFDRRKSKLQISFDLYTDEHFDRNEEFVINTTDSRVLIPLTKEFRVVSKEREQKPFSLAIKGQPVLYSLDRRENSIETIIGNYVIISLDFKSFRLIDLSQKTYFNKIFFKTDFVELQANLPGEIVHTDSMLSIRFNPTLKYKVEEQYWDLVDELNQKLVERGVPAEWLIENIDNDNFRIYHNVVRHFTAMPEHQVSRGERDQNWYMRHFGVDEKVRKGADFRRTHLQALQAAERRTGVHYEMVMAILAIESDYANPRFRGNFYTFGTLVSQYVLLPRRQRFAVNELVALYEFTQKTGKDTYHFIGSFAGASGWGQFIPTSMNAYFIDANDNFHDVDIFAIDDTIHSIANYLRTFGLNSRTMSNYQARYKAVHAYNKSDAYVKAVLYIYDKLYEQRRR